MQRLRVSAQVRTMKELLIPSNVPRLYEQEDAEDPIVYVKLFTPCSSWTWLITEYEPVDDLAFGFCYDGSYPEGAELAYVSVGKEK